MIVVKQGRLLAGAIAVFSLLLISTRAAQAELIRFRFSGTLVSVVDDDNVLGGQYSVGDPFTASLAYDSEIPDETPDTPAFTSSDASIVATFHLSGLDFVGNQNTELGAMAQINSPFAVLQSGVINGLDTGEITILFAGGPSQFGDELPTSIYLESLTTKRVNLHGTRDGHEFRFSGKIDALVVPEPSTFVIAGISLIGLVPFLRRRLRHC